MTCMIFERKISSVIEQYFKTDDAPILVIDGERQVGKSFIIHDAAYYKKYKLPDDYRKFPGMIVQHLTVEKCITENDEDAIDSIMNVLIKELFIKECVSLGEDFIGHWKDRGFEDDMMFLKRVQVSKKPRRYFVNRLTIHPDGKFGFDRLDDNDPFLFEMREIWHDNKSTSDTEHMIVYKRSVCTIENSGIVPVIDNEVLMESVVKLEQKRKELKESQDPENPKKKKARVLTEKVREDIRHITMPSTRLPISRDCHSVTISFTCAVTTEQVWSRNLRKHPTYVW